MVDLGEGPKTFTESFVFEVVRGLGLEFGSCIPHLFSKFLDPLLDLSRLRMRKELESEQYLRVRAECDANGF